MFRSGKHRHLQDRRLWTDEKLKQLYKESGTDRGMKVAITRELNARAGKTPLHSPQAKRQRTLQWTMMNLMNSRGMIQRAVHELQVVRKDLSAAEFDKLTGIIVQMMELEQKIGKVNSVVKEAYPSKKSLKEKENA